MTTDQEIINVQIGMKSVFCQQLSVKCHLWSSMRLICSLFHRGRFDLQQSCLQRDVLSL